jgi:hypothetical protein
MRNNRRKRHALETTTPSFLAVRYSQPQQANSAASARHSSQTSASATSKKKKSAKKSRHARREPSQKAPTPDRISEIQSSLARGGYYQGDPNGKWDANTIAAMQKFQSANGLDPSGKLDAPSLQKLGLGSGIAGVSAPKPATMTAPAAPQKPATAPSSSTNPGADTPSASTSTVNTSGNKPPQR